MEGVVGCEGLSWRYDCEMIWVDFGFLMVGDVGGRVGMRRGLDWANPVVFARGSRRQ